jgi:metal-sulfur cluster biosynthetic enzyme
MDTIPTVDVDTIREALRDVIDPELGLNVIDLGMIPDVQISAEGDVVVYMVLTTMTCPFWGLFVDQVKTALGDVAGIREVDVRYDPRHRWSPALMTEDARWELESQGLLLPGAT